MASHGYQGLFYYIDDLIYTGLPSEIHNSFQFLLNLFRCLSHRPRGRFPEYGL